MLLIFSSFPCLLLPACCTQSPCTTRMGERKEREEGICSVSGLRSFFSFPPLPLLFSLMLCSLFPAPRYEAGREQRVLHDVTSGLLRCKDMGWNLVILNQPNREFVSSYHQLSPHATTTTTRLLHVVLPAAAKRAAVVSLLLFSSLFSLSPHSQSHTQESDTHTKPLSRRRASKKTTSCFF